MSKISYSRYKRYMQCAQLEKYHSIERLRPTKRSSALIFGVAMDNVINHVLLNQGEPLEAYYDLLRDKLNEFAVVSMSDIEWQKIDFDFDLLDDTIDTDGVAGLITQIKYKGLHSLTEEQSERVSVACFSTLWEKGKLLIETYVKEVLPRIDKVISVQKEINIKFEHGELIGYTDAIIERNGKRILIDNKTSAKPYKDDACLYDTQMSLYASAEGIEYMSYVVMIKEIEKNRTKVCTSCGFDGSSTGHKTCNGEVKGKRCHGAWKYTIKPKGIVQILSLEVPKINKDLIRTAINDTMEAINKNIYPRNLQACGQMYGKRCPYFNKCWKNKDWDLEVVPERKK